MKNIKILIVLFAIVLLCGCGTNENKLVKYLKSIDYACTKNVCVYESKEDSQISIQTTFDIDNKLYKKHTTFTQLQSSDLELNWETNKVKYEYKLLNETFNIDYDIENETYECNSNSANSVYKKAECSHLIDDLKQDVKSFNTIIDLSGEKIK